MENMNAEQMKKQMAEMGKILKMKEEEEKRQKEIEENKELNEYVEKEKQKYNEMNEEEKDKKLTELFILTFKKKAKSTTNKKNATKENIAHTENEEECKKNCCYSMKFVNANRTIQCNEPQEENELFCKKCIKQLKSKKLCKDGIYGLFGNWYENESIHSFNKNHYNWCKKYYGEEEKSNNWNEEEKAKILKYLWFNEEEEKEEKFEKEIVEEVKEIVEEKEEEKPKKKARKKKENAK